MSVKCFIVNFMIILLFTAGIITFFNIGQSYAEFNISVRPYDGGFELRFAEIERFSPIDTEKEVTVTVNSDIGKRYQVIQSLLDPLTNTEGVTLPGEAFTIYTLKGSNATGTLGLDSAVPVMAGRTLIYNSNESGMSDSFTIVYTLRYSLVKAPGLYRGRLNFFLEPIDSTEAPATVKLDVEVDIEIPAKIEVSTLTGSKIITLELPEKETLPAEVTISIQGQQQGQYKILQVVEPLIDQEGKELTQGVYFLVKGGKNGIIAQAGETMLRQGRTLLYTSSSRGEDAEIKVTYSLKEGLKSARYRGKISHYIEGPVVYPKGGLIDALQLEVDIEPIFKLKAVPQMGSIHFGDIRPGKLQQSEVLIEVETNLAEPYQVSQRLLSLLTNQQGQTVPQEAFTVRTVALEEKGAQGTLKYLLKTPAKEGQMVVFVSNSEGKPESFKIIYELNVTRRMDVKPGDYSAQIVYSMSAL